MRGCGRHYCPHCGQEMIHRDHRRFYESSSGLGQIIHRDGTRNYGVADVDGAIERTRNRRATLRVIEQKQSTHQFKGSQKTIMWRLAELIDAAVQQQFVFKDGATITPDSGVFVTYCEIVPQTESNTLILPPKIAVQQLRDGTAARAMSPLEFLLWLPSTAEERARMSGRQLLQEFVDSKPKTVHRYKEDPWLNS